MHPVDSFYRIRDAGPNGAMIVGGIFNCSLACSLLIPVDDTGADVSHPSPHLNQPSFSALVASIGKAAQHYVVEQGVQESRQELMSNLSEMMAVCYASPD